VLEKGGEKKNEKEKKKKKRRRRKTRTGRSNNRLKTELLTEHSIPCP